MAGAAPETRIAVGAGFRARGNPRPGNIPEKPERSARTSGGGGSRTWRSHPHRGSAAVVRIAVGAGFRDRGNPRPETSRGNRNVPHAQVEVAGVEPASKQGTRKLSTRLVAVSSFYPSLAGDSLTRVPVPQISRVGRNAPARYLRIDDTPYGEGSGSGTLLRDTRRYGALAAAIKPIFLEN